MELATGTQEEHETTGQEQQKELESNLALEVEMALGKDGHGEGDVGR